MSDEMCEHGFAGMHYWTDGKPVGPDICGGPPVALPRSKHPPAALVEQTAEALEKWLQSYPSATLGEKPWANLERSRDALAAYRAWKEKAGTK